MPTTSAPTRWRPASPARPKNRAAWEHGHHARAARGAGAGKGAAAAAQTFRPAQVSSACSPCLACARAAALVAHAGDVVDVGLVLLGPVAQLELGDTGDDILNRRCRSRKVGEGVSAGADDEIPAVLRRRRRPWPQCCRVPAVLDPPATLVLPPLVTFAGAWVAEASPAIAKHVAPTHGRSSERGTLSIPMPSREHPAERGPLLHRTCAHDAPGGACTTVPRLNFSSSNTRTG